MQLERHLLHILLLMVIIVKSHSSSVNDLPRKFDACECRTASKIDATHIVDQIFAKSAYYFLCCANNFVSNYSTDFNVSWSFTSSGFDGFESTSTFKEEIGCYGQKMSTMSVDPLDSGNYTCIVTGADGTIYKRTISTLVYAPGGYLGKPLFVNSSGPVYTDVGRSVNLSCSFYMGNGTMAPDIFWRKIYANSSAYFELIARVLPHVEESPVIVSDGVYLAELKLKNISDIHFGNYSCQMVTSSIIISQNISVYRGSHPMKVKEERLELLVAVASVLLICLFFSSCIVYRTRMDIALKWRKLSKKSADKVPPSIFRHDVFIVNGPSVLYWVYTVLLTRLEGEWFYGCFLPDRDILGGEGTVETICQALRESKRTLIIVTDCLLRSKWCTFMMNQAIHNTVVNPSKVFAIVLTDVSSVEQTSLKAQNILKILKCVKKINCPISFVPQPYTVEENDDEVSWRNSAKNCEPEVTCAYTEHSDDANMHSETINVRKNCLPNSLSSPNFLDEAYGTTHFTSLPSFTLQLPYSSLSNLKTLSETDSGTDSQNFEIFASRKVENMIYGSSEFLERKIMNNKMTDSEKAEKDLDTNQQISRSSYNLEENNRCQGHEIQFAKPGRNHFNSESSSDYPLSPCSNAPFFPDESERRYTAKTLKLQLKHFLFGNPRDLFWKKFRLHLPHEPQRKLHIGQNSS